MNIAQLRKTHGLLTSLLRPTHDRPTDTTVNHMGSAVDSIHQTVGEQLSTSPSYRQKLRFLREATGEVERINIAEILGVAYSELQFFSTES